MRTRQIVKAATTPNSVGLEETSLKNGLRKFSLGLTHFPLIWFQGVST